MAGRTRVTKTQKILKAIEAGDSFADIAQRLGTTRQVIKQVKRATEQPCEEQQPAKRGRKFTRPLLSVELSRVREAVSDGQCRTLTQNLELMERILGHTPTRATAIDLLTTWGVEVAAPQSFPSESLRRW